MSKPNPERNAGARAERAAIRGIIRERREKYDQAELADESYVLTEILNLIQEHASATGKRKGGTGRK